jgi:hypothetical protein
VTLFVEVTLYEVVPETIGAEFSVIPQGFREGPATLRQHKAFEVGVQMCTSPGRYAPRVGKQDSPGHDDAQQV